MPIIQDRLSADSSIKAFWEFGLLSGFRAEMSKVRATCSPFFLRLPPERGLAPMDCSRKWSAKTSLIWLHAQLDYTLISWFASSTLRRWIVAFYGRGLGSSKPHTVKGLTGHLLSSTKREGSQKRTVLTRRSPPSNLQSATFARLGVGEKGYHNPADHHGSSHWQFT